MSSETRFPPLDPSDSSSDVGNEGLHSSSNSDDSHTRRSSKYVLGLVMLLIVVCLWVGSSALIQQIFVGLNFRGPFFLTYYSTSLFSLYLGVYALKTWLSTRWKNGGGLLCCGGSERSRLRRNHQVLGITNPDGSSVNSSRATTPDSAVAALPHHQPTVQSVLVSEGGTIDENDIMDEHHSNMLLMNKVTVRQTAMLSLQLCPIWFFMNYCFNLSLNLTSIASSTILSTTSSLFVLIFSYFMDNSIHIVWQHILGTVLTIVGVALISYKDTKTDDSAETDTSDNSLPHHLMGDVVATLGALCYGFYTVLLKLRIPANEELIEMQLVFGFLGLFNTILFWPGFFILDALGVEKLQSPPNDVLLFLTINGIFGTVISDYLWAKSVLLTSPLIASLGLALTIPLALLVDWMFHHLQFNALYLFGGAAVLVGFIMVNLVHQKEERQNQEGEDDRDHASQSYSQSQSTSDESSAFRHNSELELSSARYASDQANDSDLHDITFGSTSTPRTDRVNTLDPQHASPVTLFALQSNHDSLSFPGATPVKFELRSEPDSNDAMDEFESALASASNANASVPAAYLS